MAAGGFGYPAAAAPRFHLVSLPAVPLGHAKTGISGLERPFGVTQSLDDLLSPAPSHVPEHHHVHTSLNTSKDRGSTSLGALSQRLPTLSVEKFFPKSNLNLPWGNLRPFLCPISCHLLSTSSFQVLLSPLCLRFSRYIYNRPVSVMCHLFFYACVVCLALGLPEESFVGYLNPPVFCRSYRETVRVIKGIFKHGMGVTAFPVALFSYRQTKK